MTVYFLQASPTGPVKIGLSFEAAARVAGMQTASAIELKVIRSIAGSGLTETWLHRQYRKLRIRREWFDFAESMLTIEPPAELIAEDIAEETADHTEADLQSIKDDLARLLAEVAVPSAERIRKLQLYGAMMSRNVARYAAKRALIIAQKLSATNIDRMHEAVAAAEKMLEIENKWHQDAEHFGGDPRPEVVVRPGSRRARQKHEKTKTRGSDLLIIRERENAPMVGRAGTGLAPPEGAEALQAGAGPGDGTAQSDRGGSVL